MAGSKTILFIEDDPFIVDMYTHVLERSGYTVDIAYDGKTGLDKARQNPYDLILIDIMVPQLTGIEVLEQLRKHSPRDLSATKIVILTNLAQDEESRRALEAEADGYLIKADITPNKLVELLTQVMGNQPPTTNHTVSGDPRGI